MGLCNLYLIQNSPPKVCGPEIQSGSQEMAMIKD